MPYRYIFQVEVRPGEEENFRESWHSGSMPIQKCLGARGTRLHLKRGAERTFIAIAEWESKEARDAAFAKLDNPDNPLGKDMRRWGENEDFGTVTLIAEVDEIDVVFPPDMK